METLGAFFDDGEWECFSTMFATEDHGQSSFLLGENHRNFGVQSMFCSTSEAEENKSTNVFYSFDSHTNYNSYESNHSTLGNTNNYFDSSDHVVVNSSKRSENFNHCQVQHIVFPNEQLKLKRMLDVQELEVHVEDAINKCRNPKKKPRTSKDVQRCMKNGESKKSLQKVEKTNASIDGHSSSGYTSEEHNMYEEISGRATSASIYARKRREKINERLRTLQNLVPNGTKVDISTMLEDAIHYVKLLQLQIKLLSSDDLWMYAPIAYNGLDNIGFNLNQKITPPP